MKKEIVKARNFAFLIYPESSPTDWIDRLTELGRPMAISPFHDLDETERKPEEMTEDERKIIQSGGKVYKKAHYHVLFIAANPVTPESVRKKIKRCLGDQSVSFIKIVDNISFYYLYLTHESADAIKKGKHRYDKAEIIHINNFDLDRYVTLDESEKRYLSNLMISAIREYKLKNMADLLDFADANVEKYPLLTQINVSDVVGSKAALYRLIFDGMFQRSKSIDNTKKDD